MISRVSPLGGCCELETHPNHDVPSTLLLRKIYLILKIYFQTNSSFGVSLQNIRSNIRLLYNTNTKRSYYIKPARKKLNLKVKSELKNFLSIFYISIGMKMKNN